jgi:WD40 repeat protein
MYRGGRGGDTVVATNIATWKVEWGLRFDDAFEPESAVVNPEGRLLVVSGLLQVRPPHPRSLAEELKQTRLEERDYILDLTNQRIVRTFQSPARDVVEWSPDGTHIALAGQQYIEVFNAHSGQREVQTHNTDAGNGNIRYTPDGRYLVESDFKGRGNGSGVKIWDAGHSKLLQKIGGDATGLAVSRDGRYLAVGTLGRTTIWRFR